MRPRWTGGSAAVTVALPSGRIARHAEHRAAATGQRLGNLPPVGGTDADSRLAMRNVVALTFFACMAACRSSSTPDDYNKEVYQAQIRTTLDAAFACERGYVRAHVQSPATITEISDATRSRRQCKLICPTWSCGWRIASLPLKLNTNEQGRGRISSRNCAATLCSYWLKAVRPGEYRRDRLHRRRL
jgi:hypothetical protein